jgi:hypothetical protein
VLRSVDDGIVDPGTRLSAGAPEEVHAGEDRRDEEPTHQALGEDSLVRMQGDFDSARLAAEFERSCLRVEPCDAVLPVMDANQLPLTATSASPYLGRMARGVHSRRS